MTATPSASASFVPPMYDIYTVDDLKMIEYNSDIGAYFYLKNDLEITSDIWRPIGSSGRPFSGKFYGDNYTITFKQDTELMPSSGFENGGSGLFGKIYSGRIYDLNVVLQGNLTSNGDNVGAFAGVVDGNGISWNYTDSSFVNCSVSANGYTISGSNNTGGFIGYLVNGTIENSSSDCSVISEENNAGGFVGYVSNGTIINSSAAGSVESVENAGGFIGSMRIGNVSGSSATGAVVSNSFSGGFIGYISDNISVTNSSANGSVKPAGAYGNFIGNWAEGHKPEVVDCLYLGKEVDLEPVPVPESSNYSMIYWIAGIALIFLIGAIAIIYFKKK